jgi:hypothetical protein
MMSAMKQQRNGAPLTVAILAAGGVERVELGRRSAIQPGRNRTVSALRAAHGSGADVNRIPPVDPMPGDPIPVPEQPGSPGVPEPEFPVDPSEPVALES